MVSLVFLLVCLIYGTTFLALKVGLDEGMPPFVFAGMRFVLAGCLMLPFARIDGKLFVPKSFSQWKGLIAVGLTATGLCFSLLYWGGKYLPSGLTALLSSVAPPFIAFSLCLKEKKGITVLEVLGFVFAMAGMLVVVMPTVQASFSLIALLAVGAVIAGELFYAQGSLFSSDVMRRHALSPLVVNAYQSLVGGIALVLLSFFFEPVAGLASVSPLGWGCLVYLTLFGTVVAATAYFWLIKSVNPVFAASWLYISPVIALLVGNVFLKEPLGGASLLGVIFVLLGVFLLNGGARPAWRRWRSRLALRRAPTAPLEEPAPQLGVI